MGDISGVITKSLKKKRGLDKLLLQNNEINENQKLTLKKWDDYLPDLASSSVRFIFIFQNDNHVMEKKMEDYKKTIMIEGEELFHVTFPQRVFEMQALLDSPDFQLEQEVGQEFQLASLSALSGLPDDFESPPVHGDTIPENDSSLPDKKAWGLPGFAPDYVVTVNPKVSVLCELVKKHYHRLLDEVQKVRLWIQLSVPQIEDGNNFGVQVQEEALSEGLLIEKDFFASMQIYAQYHFTRGQGVTKIGKYPQVEDYQVYVREWDEKMLYRLRSFVRAMRNRYLTYHDLIKKNLQKIKKPRNDNSASLY